MTTSNVLFPRLKRNAQRGSKPRCHLLTHGLKEEVAARLTQLVAPFAIISSSDEWMPLGFEEIEECELHRHSRVLNSELCDQLAAWWLPAEQSTDKTPNFDIVGTCVIEDRPGLLLVEAKAHENELKRESVGRKVSLDYSMDRQIQRETSQKTIGAAIKQANERLSAETKLEFKLSVDCCYQMSNRFAWAWKVVDSGIPVVLVYLGFLNANDMALDSRPFTTHSEWESLVRSEGCAVVPDAVWNRIWSIRGHSFVPLIRSMDQPLG